MIELFQIVLMTCALQGDGKALDTSQGCKRWLSHDQFLNEDACNERLAEDKNLAKQWLQYSAKQFPRGTQLMVSGNCLPVKFEGVQA